MKIQFSHPHHRQRGIALVITLILLSVTLIMAVAFMAVARRERNAVNTTTDTALARLATDSALAAAEGRIMANYFATTNPYNFGLLVSTNFISNPAVPYNPVDPAWAIDILPRPPVFVVTNAATGATEFRFYLDANRNGKYDGNGVVPNVDSSGATNGTVFATGDPEWIGMLELPNFNPLNNNKFIARYAFLAQPVGNALDLNFIHNQTRSGNLPNLPNPFSALNDGYFRNQGVGSWELNLAAFLADLNTNQWDPITAPYLYRQPANDNSGNAFSDSQSFLAYRCANDYNTLAIPSANMVSALTTRGIDGYTIGTLMTTTLLPTLLSPAIQNWAGSDNTNHFFALTSDLYDPIKSSVIFTNHLALASAGVSTYDSYTFYRLLEQLGTDTTPDDTRMNLNYNNLDSKGAVVAGSETNLIAWTALSFFTNAANRLLTNYTANWLAADYRSYVATYNMTNAFAFTNIPVLVSNQLVYTPAVHRLLQLAANIYDASTNSPWPSVFRPTFRVLNQGGIRNVYITGYQQVTNVVDSADVQLKMPTNLQAWASGLPAAQLNTLCTTNIYGVPWIIGAKKGLPNFNQFSMLTDLQVTRKLQVTKPSMTASLSQFRTNQMYEFSLTNLLGCSLWNSYTSAYTAAVLNGIGIVARDNLTVLLTNDAPAFGRLGFTNLQLAINPYSTTVWAGTTWATPDPSVLQLDHHSNYFIVPFTFTNAFLTNDAIYRYANFRDIYNVNHPNPYFDPDPNDTIFQTNVQTPPLPHFGLLITNRLQVFVLNSGHVIDYVSFDGPKTYLDVNTNLADPDSAATGTPAYLWSTNGYNGGSTPWGVINQINISMGSAGLPGGEKWITMPNLPAGLPNPTPTLEQTFFKAFFDTVPAHPGVLTYGGKLFTNTLLKMKAPYVPTRIITNLFSWQANDPLVHYLASDLEYNNGPLVGKISSADILTLGTNFPSLDLTNLTTPYSPWGQDYFAFHAAQNNGKKENYVPAGKANWLTTIKDSLVWRSDYWDFPTNRYPTVGWLGRVHRGTPWQTVYLKASDIMEDSSGYGRDSWAKWTGNTNYFDATNALPAQDFALFDLFSTALNPNATRGTMPINLGGGSADPAAGIAAWSALFSGIVALTNSSAAPTSTTNSFAPWIVEPAGAGGPSSALWNLVTNINFARANLTNLDGVVGSFEHIGNILKVPVLTEQSPFLNTNTVQQQFGISDAVYEWLPQQIMSLLRVTTLPRYVIYCYGQALRPAPNSIVTGTANFGMVTNYQIMAESAARAVVHVNRNVVTNALGVVTGTNYSTVVESYNLLPPQ